MANVRIKDLTTTAATTASDDFFGVDGATNGTRKLNAYSPTFGGNLTVSGNQASIAGNGVAPILFASGSGYNVISLNNSTTFASTVGMFGAASGDNNLYINAPTGREVDIRINNANVAQFTGTATTLAGNLTVSGTGTSTFAGAVQVTNANDGIGFVLKSNTAVGSKGGIYWHKNTGTEIWRIIADPNANNGDELLIRSAAGVEALKFANATGAATFAGNLTVSGTGTSSVAGTLLLGTTTDSANGKLQLATHTTSAGGIGFGTALSVYRSSDNSLWADAASGNIQLVLGRSGIANLAVLGDGSNIYISSAVAGSGLILRTNGGTTALTLDSSQNATFAGKITASSSSQGLLSLTGSSSTGTNIRLKNTATNGRDWGINSNVTFGQGEFSLYDYTAGYESFRLTGTSSGTATIYPTGGLIVENGPIKTAAPSGGTAGAWKLGVRVAATTLLDTTQYLQVDIGGTLYKVALVTA